MNSKSQQKHNKKVRKQKKTQKSNQIRDKIKKLQCFFIFIFLNC